MRPDTTIAGILASRWRRIGTGGVKIVDKYEIYVDIETGKYEP